MNGNTICMANMPSEGFVAVNSINEGNYTVLSLTSYEIHKGRIIDGAFFSVDVLPPKAHQDLVSRGGDAGERYDGLRARYPRRDAQDALPV